jgi:membrane protein implicated in regulation of membrane protease activity
MDAWLIWLAVAAGLGVAELVATTLDLALLAVAALAAAGVAAFDVGIGIQFLTFCVVAVVMMVTVRPIIRSRMMHPPLIRTGAAALVGREAVTLTEVGRDSGRVRIRGEEWSARPYMSDLVIPAGTTVDVFAIEGATALVHPREDPWSNSSSA